MSRETIEDAQGYLTYISESQVKRIVNVEDLIKHHPAEEVISYLKDVYREKQRFLKIMIDADKTSSRVNETVVAMFRIYMALQVLISEGKEVIEHGNESRAESRG